MIDGTKLAEKGYVPDLLIRQGIRHKLAGRLALQARTQPDGIEDFADELRQMPVAIQTDRANEQHYELPSGFFTEVLGGYRKYSAGYWPEGVSDLDAAEVAALDLVVQRADIQSDQDVLDLGCGWGSFTLFAAGRFPESRFTAISNSRTQRAFIEEQARERGLNNVRVITADANTLTEVPGTYDRIVSIEMFEHMKNYEILLGRISGWLKEEGRLFVHIFTHRDYAYHYEAEGENDWMSRHFFAGGTMPADELLLHFQRDLLIERHWRLNGVHYQKSLEAWLERMDAKRDVVMPIMEEVYGKDDARMWFERWRLFFLACSELFGYRGGNEWMVSHYRFCRRA